MNARLHLRDATRPAHERTDAAFSALDLAQKEDYRVFLASHLLAYRALEPVFAADMTIDLRPPAMADLLMHDLRALGSDEPAMRAPAFDADALGAAYVVAGSHFGKRVLSRRQGRSSDPAMQAATRYLSSPALSTYWPVLRQGIEQAWGVAGYAERMTDGAKAAFELFSDCLSLACREAARHEFA